MNLTIFERTTSTNDLGQQEQYHHGDVIWAYEQSAGRGQRGNRWVDGVGHNLTFSVVLEPKIVAANEQFVISQITALALHETLGRFGIDAKIKWTNDIYVGDYKIAGVLIENSLHGGCVARSVIGVGLNVNQSEFDPALPNPTSMYRCSGSQHGREEVLRQFHELLMDYYDRLSVDALSAREVISERYHKALYRLDEEHTYQLQSGEQILATLKGVRDRGELVLEHEDGEIGEYLFREVGFVINSRD